MERVRPKKRTGKGQFAPGNAGGPGRPPGYRSRVAWALDQIAEKDCTEILEKLISLAKEGDVQAMKFILDRYWPAPKSRTVRFERPTITTTVDIPKALDAVLSAVANGELTPEEGTSVAGLIEQQRKALEHTEYKESQRRSSGEEVGNARELLAKKIAAIAERLNPKEAKSTQE